MEESNSNNEYFWPSYVDFVMVLFFIALALGGYMFIEYKKKIQGLEKYQTLVNQVIKINESLKKEFEQNHIQIDFSNKEKIKLKGDFYFDVNKSILKAEVIDNIIAIGNSFKAVLDKDSNFVKYSIVIEGHTDSDGSDEINNNLSFQRALAITNIWSKMCSFKLPKYEVLPAGYGKLKPIVENNSEDNKALNRRIEISIIPKLSEFTKMVQTSEMLAK